MMAWLEILCLAGLLLALALHTEALDFQWLADQDTSRQEWW